MTDMQDDYTNITPINNLLRHLTICVLQKGFYNIS